MAAKRYRDAHLEEGLFAEIEEKVSNSDFVNLDTIIEKFSKLEPNRFTSDSKYIEIVFSLCKEGKLNLLKPLLEELEDKNIQNEDKYTF